MQGRTTPLIEVEPGNANRRVDIVPLRGDVFVANLKITLLSRRKWSIVLGEQPLFIPQHDLVERIVEFERNFDLLDAAVTTVFHRAKNKSHFLV